MDLLYLILAVAAIPLLFMLGWRVGSVRSRPALAKCVNCKHMCGYHVDGKNCNESVWNGDYRVGTCKCLRYDGPPPPLSIQELNL